MQGRLLFDKVVSSCGISTVLAPGIVRRALLDQKVRVDDAFPADYLAALPRLEARLAAYLSAEDTERTIRRIEALLSQAASADEPLSDEHDDSLLGQVSIAVRPEEGALRRTGERVREEADPATRKDAGNED
jgi:hypothetical protein